jgi:hypothetical protein
LIVQHRVVGSRVWRVVDHVVIHAVIDWHQVDVGYVSVVRRVAWLVIEIVSCQRVILRHIVRNHLYLILIVKEWLCQVLIYVLFHRQIRVIVYWQKDINLVVLWHGDYVKYPLVIVHVLVLDIINWLIYVSGLVHVLVLSVIMQGHVIGSVLVDIVVLWLVVVLLDVIGGEKVIVGVIVDLEIGEVYLVVVVDDRVGDDWRVDVVSVVDVHVLVFVDWGLVVDWDVAVD